MTKKTEETTMNTLDTLGVELWEFVAPVAMILFVLIFGLLMKDFAIRIAKGLAFRFANSFSEGDKVILDGEEAIIVKIGTLNTVFGITKADGTYAWRYVPNERIPFIKLERVIFTNV